MNKEEYYKRLEKTTEKIKTDRCSEDEIANINRQKLYLAEHYISSLEQENQKYKELIDKVINELFNLKDIIYNPETREETIDIQRKISSIIKDLKVKEVE